ncbi:MAG TPA: class I SAM-dependent methyltransferase [Chloroflexota bacterium]|jgi:SAM-dependent methyltransferase
MDAMDRSDLAIRAGGLDWAAHWRRLLEAREAAGRAPATMDGCRWDARADRFARLTQALDAATDPFVQTLRAAVQPSDTLLDVGAGAGRYCLPLAPHVARVTAVEPSPGMRARLAAAAERRDLDNVDVVAGSWPQAAVEPHDVVVVANVLYFVRDVVPFLEKLDRSARRACFLLHRVEPRLTPLLARWQEIGGQAPLPEPGFLDLYNVLFAMGIRASARLLPREFAVRYDTLEEAVAEVREFLAVGPGPHPDDAQIRALLAEILVERDGRLGLPHEPQMAIVSWEKP